MSDDTPTERFPANDPADGAPTRRLPEPQAPATPRAAAGEPAWTPVPGGGHATERLTPAPQPTGATRAPVLETEKSKAPLYWLIGIGAALLIAIVILLIVLLGGDDDEQPVTEPTTSETPIESPTPSETPIAEPEETVAPPAPASPTFATFSAPSSAECQDGEEQIPLTFTWSSTDAVRAFIGVQTTNAKDSPFASDLPPTHTFTNITYNCQQDSQVYTVTLEDAAGALAHETVTVTR
jgi:hypothetical protein